MIGIFDSTGLTSGTAEVVLKAMAIPQVRKLIFNMPPLKVLFRLQRDLPFFKKR